MIERYSLLCLYFVLIKLGQGADPKPTNNCVKQDLRRITGDCTHSETQMVLRINSFSFQLKIDEKATLSQTIDISITVAKCELKGKAFNTPYGNVVSIGGSVYAPTITVSGDQRSLRLLDPKTNNILFNETCVPTIEQKSQRFIVSFSWDLSATETSLNVEFDGTVEFDLPSTTSKPGLNDSSSLPTWAWIVIAILAICLVICIIVLICICIYFCCFEKRRKRPEKVDVGVPATEFGDPAYPPSHLNFSDSRPSLSHLSVVSDFESFSGVPDGGLVEFYHGTDHGTGQGTGQENNRPIPPPPPLPPQHQPRQQFRE